MREERGFTLIELVVVIAILGVLAAIATPLVTNYLGQAETRAYTNDVKQVQAAVNTYYSAPDNQKFIGYPQYPIYGMDKASNGSGLRTTDGDVLAATSVLHPASPNNPLGGTKGGSPTWTDDGDGIRNPDNSEEVLRATTSTSAGWHLVTVTRNNKTYYVDTRDYIIDMEKLVDNGLLKEVPASAADDNCPTETCTGNYIWYVDADGKVQSMDRYLPSVQSMPTPTPTATPVPTATPTPTPTPVAVLLNSGSYVGNGTDDRAITGVGFQPDLVIIKGDTTQVASMRISTMSGDSTKPLVGGTALTANMVQTIDTNGFTIGTHATVNSSSITYYWTAFKATAGELKVGSYTGNGTSQSITGLGFSPGYVIVMSASSSEAVHRSTTMPKTYFFNAEDGDSGNRITSLGADEFTVGNSSRVNTSGITYYYVAWKVVAGKVNVGSYTGNGADNRSITGIGFQPEYVILRGEGLRETTHKSLATGAATDTTLFFRTDVNKLDMIQALESNGFQVGTNTIANESGIIYHWIAFRSTP